jgi:hypothetical protein
MRCADFKEKGILYLYQELPQAEAAELQEHLTSCTTCRQSLAQLEKTRALMQQLETPAPSDLVLQNLVNAAMPQRRPRVTVWDKIKQIWRLPLMPMPRWATVSAAMAITVVLVAGLYFLPLKRNPASVADEWGPYIDNGIVAISDEIEATEWEWSESNDPMAGLDQEINDLHNSINNAL